jgi:hypothetical protein
MRRRGAAGIRVVIRWVALLGISVSTLRICALLFEAWAVSSDTRIHDLELLKVCESGVAGQSPKMRDVCLRARSDVASPLLIKVILLATSVAYGEFCEAISTPWRLTLLLLFCFSTAVSGPILFWARTIAKVASLAGEVDEQPEFLSDTNSRVVIMPPNMQEFPEGVFRFQRGIRGVLNLKKRMFPRKLDIEEITDEGYESSCFAKSL